MPATDTRTSTSDRTRCPRRARVLLTSAALALLATQIVHVAVAQLTVTPQAHHAAPGRALHLIGILGALAVVVALWRRRPRAALGLAIAGALTALAVVVLHVVPLAPSYTNAYYGAGLLPWATVGAVIVAALAAVGTARRQAGRYGPTPTPTP